MGGMRTGRVRSCCEGSRYGVGNRGVGKGNGGQDDCSITGRDLARR